MHPIQILMIYILLLMIFEPITEWFVAWLNTYHWHTERDENFSKDEQLLVCVALAVCLVFIAPYFALDHITGGKIAPLVTFHKK